MYESSCELCNPPDRKVTKDERMVISGKGTYIGETSRSIFERASEHVEAAKNLEVDSHMAKHWFTDHPQEPEVPKFDKKG